jgi:glycosyltransferase involved in cell wall biosynthesis
MAYGYSKILINAGKQAAVYCNNITHIMSQPEWDDLDLDPEGITDENNFYSHTLDLKDYKRPSWFHSDMIWTYNNPKISKLASYIPLGLRKKLKPAYYHLWNQSALLLAKWRKNTNEFDLIMRAKQIEKMSQQYEQRWWVSKQDVMLYAQQAHWLFAKRTADDILFNYMYAPITAFILDSNPFVSIEIGTIRDIPFENSTLGKLLALSYRKSPYLLITNPDGREHALRLGISPERFQFIPHPIDNNLYKPIEENQQASLREQLNIPKDMDLVLFAPARQNWDVKGNDQYLHAFAELMKQKVKCCLIIPGWGQEVARSKKLCQKLGIEPNVRWVKPMSDLRLIKYMQAVDVVIDQFQLGVFGLITAKALACGKPVITSYDKKTHEWCFSNHPPLLAGSTSQEIFQHLFKCSQNKSSLLQYGNLSRQWILEHYSNELIVKTLTQAMALAKKFYNADKQQLGSNDG